VALPFFYMMLQSMPRTIETLSNGFFVGVDALIIWLALFYVLSKWY